MKICIQCVYYTPPAQEEKEATCSNESVNIGYTPYLVDMTQRKCASERRSDEGRCNRRGLMFEQADSITQKINSKAKFFKPAE